MLEAISTVHCHISTRVANVGLFSLGNYVMGFYVMLCLMLFSYTEMCIKILLSNYFISILHLDACEDAI